MAAILADGQWWTDADGQDSWTLPEAVALAEVLESSGYHVEIIPGTP